MLTYINIKNFALIKELELDLPTEMTVLTGETGAGKSIIIDSLELVLGARADTSFIHNNADRCEITAMFDLTNLPQVRNLLIEQELDSENECIIRRIISSDGRSKSSINGNPCTQQTLRTISESLISIHGQHEHQTLLNNEKQQELLDAFANNQTLVTQVKQLYNLWFRTKKELTELENNATDYLTKIDFLNYQLKELELIDCSLENLEKLRTEQKRFSNVKQVASNLNLALEIIAESEAGSVISNLYNAKNKLEKCLDTEPNIDNTITLLQSAIIHAQEASANLRQNLHAIEFNEEHQRQVEEQLTHIYDLAHKHQVPPQDLPLIRLNLEQQITYLQNITLQLEKTKTTIIELEKSYLKTANELSLKRQIAAEQLNKLVSEKMQLLGMIGGKFVANLLPLTNQEFSSYGLERVEFLVSANPGQPLQLLNKVASGGELSRISLAIQVITAEKEITPTLIFDEIDAGIGGKTADIVGQLLRQLAENTQVICVTHLPQIAVQGQHHIYIEKITKNKHTEINLTTLNQNERVNEIARMLGGVKITNQTLAHAKEMLNSVI